MMDSNDFVNENSLNSNSKQTGIGFGQRLIGASINLLENPWTAAAIASYVFLSISYFFDSLITRSNYAYFNYLADSFLHGQTWLRLVPPRFEDLIFFHDKLYLYWAPFPALLLTPFVSIFGVDFNDVLFTTLIASINVGLVAQLLRVSCKVEFLHLRKSQRAILVFFFAFGTVHSILSPQGKAWATSQIIGFSCSLLAYLAAFSLKGKKAWFFTGLALAAALLTRTQIVFTGIFPSVYLLIQEKPWMHRRQFLELLLAIIPLLSAVGFVLFYNQIRFGNPLDFGLAYHNMDKFFRADFQKYGFFNLHYIPTNLYYQYVFFPYPLQATSLMGGSLFLMSPLFLTSFGAFVNPRSKIFLWVLMGSILITNIPIILCMGTGYMQYGPRYTLDFTVPLLLLTALGMEKIHPHISFILAFISVFIYTAFYL